MPALLTSTSSRPKCSRVAATALLDLLEVGDVHLQRQRADLLGQVGARGRVAQPERDVRARLGERDRDRAADAAGRARDQADLPLESEVRHAATLTLKAFWSNPDQVLYIYGCGYGADGTRHRAPGRPGRARLRGRALPPAAGGGLLLPEGGLGRPGPDPARGAGCAGLHARHARPVPGDLRDLEGRRGALRDRGRGLPGPEPRPPGRRARRPAVGARPRRLLRPAQGAAAQRARSPTSTPGSPACAATSRPRAPARPSSPGTPSTSAGSSTRSPTGPTRTCGATSRARPALQRAARPGLPDDRLHALHACPARGAKAAGPAPARPSAACTPERPRPRRRRPRRRASRSRPAEPEHVGEDLLRVLAERRRAPRAASRPAAVSSSGEAGHEVRADPGLLDRGEHRVLLGGARVLVARAGGTSGTGPQETPVPSNAARTSSSERASNHGPQHRRDDVARAEAPVLGGEVVARDALAASGTPRAVPVTSCSAVHWRPVSATTITRRPSLVPKSWPKAP